MKYIKKFEMSNYRSPGKTSINIGDEIVFNEKYGYWDVSKYPYGGDFKRFSDGEHGVVIDGPIKKPFEIRVKLSDNRIIVTNANIQSIKTINGADFKDNDLEDDDF